MDFAPSLTPVKRKSRNVVISRKDQIIQESTIFNVDEIYNQDKRKQQDLDPVGFEGDLGEEEELKICEGDFLRQGTGTTSLKGTFVSVFNPSPSQFKPELKEAELNFSKSICCTSQEATTNNCNISNRGHSRTRSTNITTQYEVALRDLKKVGRAHQEGGIKHIQLR